MAGTIFITGARGFIGSAVTPRLIEAGWRVKGLARGSVPAGSDARVEWIAGDLLEPDSYRAALSGVDVVVHLAAATGKDAPRRYRTVNVDGARALIEAARDAGVGRFLHVSTIAAGYADQRHYPYASTKAEAEELVKESGIAHTILRPTLVLGEGSPIWATLQRIARLPVIPLPQGARPVRVQPVHVNDVARAIVLLLEAGRFDGETFDVGGADPETFADFLNIVRRELAGKAAPVISAPLYPIREMLALAEPVARPFLPVTAGQLALFANDSTARPSWLMDQITPGAPSTRALIAGLVPRKDDRASPPPSGDADLEAEGRVLCRYIAGAEPPAQLLQHYAAACRVHGVAADAAQSPFDRAALALARRGPMRARMADAFCAVFHRGGALRRKVIIMTALLESAAPSSETFDAPQSPGPLGAFLQLAGAGLAFASAMLAGAFMLGGARLTKSVRA